MCYNISMPAKKLYRSSKNKIIAGVCGGIAEYFDIDPTIVRIIFVLIALIDGIGVILYLIMALIVPTKDGSDIRANAEELAGRVNQAASGFRKNDLGKNLLGVAIVFLGLMLLLKNLLPAKMIWFGHGIFWSGLIIAIGLYLIIKTNRRL